MRIIKPVKFSLKELVNRLIKESFGKSFRGDLNLVPDKWTENILTGQVSRFYFEIGKLGYIGKRGFYIPFITSPNYHLVGGFTNEEGSYLKILPDYLKQAKQYAHLYEAATHRDAVIEVIESFEFKLGDHAFTSSEFSGIRCKVLSDSRYGLF